MGGELRCKRPHHHDTDQQFRQMHVVCLDWNAGSYTSGVQFFSLERSGLKLDDQAHVHLGLRVSLSRDCAAQETQTRARIEPTGK